jgi:phospholipid/cholesterol/gamma-HCH transport system substrate-binding protein
VNGTVEEASTTLVDVRGRLDVALDAVTNTVNNTNGIVTGIRQGHGSIGALLNDPQMTADLKGAVANTRNATANLNDLSTHAAQVMSDVQSRNLPGKADQTLENVRNASAQINQAAIQVNTTLTQALGPDRDGQTAVENLQQTLGNLNAATSNMAEDTEALKHEFFFRGFFKKRGFYALSDLTPQDYRANTFFPASTESRFWLQPEGAFTSNSEGRETLSAEGKRQIDAFMEKNGAGQSSRPIMVEGYSALNSPLDQVVQAKERALLVKSYLERRLALDPRNIGVVGLGTVPPPSAGKATWDGISILLLKRAK